MADEIVSGGVCLCAVRHADWGCSCFALSLGD